MRGNGWRIITAFGSAAVTTIIWHQFHKCELALPKEAEIILGTAVLVLAAIFAIAGAMILTGVWERLRKASKYVLMRDKMKFLLIRDERMPIAMLLMLASSGLCVIFLLGAAHYPSSASGIAVMFPVTFSITFFFIVIRDVQGAIYTSPWFTTRISDDWWKEDVDDYFLLKPSGDGGDAAAENPLSE